MNIKIFYYTLIAALFFSLTASASERMKTFVEQDYGNDEIHGLAYVNDKAKEFMAEYNKQNNTHWQTYFHALGLVCKLNIAKTNLMNSDL